MAAGIVGPAGVTITTPAARDTYVKVGILEVADGSTGFAAFVLPKYAVVIGTYLYAGTANATQTVNVGFTNGGVELINAGATATAGYATTGAQTGASFGTQLTADKIVYLKASATLTGPVVVKIEYYIPPQGLTL